jgi:hypothetical protein
MSGGPPSCMLASATRTRTVAVLSTLAIGAAACSSVDAPASSDELSSALARIEVEDAYTAVVIRSVSAPTFPFQRSDGRYHVAYDLTLTNASRVPATVDRVDVVRAGDPSKVIVSYSGTALVDPDCPIGNCNRLRHIPSSPAHSRHDAGAPAMLLERLGPNLHDVHLPVPDLMEAVLSTLGSL